MRKLAVVVIFLAMAGPVFASDNFIKSEADRSGTTGTLNMVGNSIQGFFSHFGSIVSDFGKTTHTKSAK